MNQRLTAEESREIIQTDSDYISTVAYAVRECDVVPGSTLELICLESSARLLADSWFESTEFVCRNPNEMLCDGNAIDEHTDEAFRYCVSLGIIPGGFVGFLIWFFVRQAAWYFLRKLIEHWWKNREKVLEKERITNSIRKYIRKVNQSNAPPG